MANVIINDTHLNNIASAIREKNGKTTKYKPAEMATAISAIETGSGSSDEWQPQPDWWNIDSILENDTSGYQGSVICLLRDSLVSTSIEPMGATKIITSDGGEYTSPSAVITHTWDTTKDKECSLGYKTRYVIWYYNTTSFPNNYNKYFPEETIYSIFNLSTIASNFGSYRNLYILESIKFKNTNFTGSVVLINGSYSLKKVSGFNVSGTNSTISASGTGIFQYCCSLEKTEDFGISFVDNWGNGSLRSAFKEMKNLKSISFSKLNIDVSKIKSYWSAFEGCTTLKTIDSIDYTSIDTSSTYNWSNMFNGCNSLVDIGTINNIHMSGLNLSTCYSLSHSTLLKFINALYDYAAEGSTDTYTLIVGTKNLAKLSDEEKAIATNKGWTLVERG